MPKLKDKFLEHVKNNPGNTDREITDSIVKIGAPQQPVNQLARKLNNSGLIIRKKREDGKIGNYLNKDGTIIIRQKINDNRLLEWHAEDNIKNILGIWLKSNGWTTNIIHGNEIGIDIEANKRNKRWIIEVKGAGKHSTMQGNFFIALLGTILQRMENPNFKYSIALPDIKRYRNLWAKLPYTAKDRTKITALFVTSDGKVIEIY